MKNKFTTFMRKGHIYLMTLVMSVMTGACFADDGGSLDALLGLMPAADATLGHGSTIVHIFYLVTVVGALAYAGFRKDLKVLGIGGAVIIIAHYMFSYVEGTL